MPDSPCSIARRPRAEEIFYNRVICRGCKFLLMRITRGREVAARSRRAHAGIGRRELLRVSFLGGSALVAGIVGVASASAGDVKGSAVPAPRDEPAKLSGKVVERVARAFFDYQISESDCDAIAPGADATIRTWQSIALRHITPIDPPFDFSLIRAEAERLARKRG